MIVLSKGYKLPETGDFGDIWFPALEDNITRLNSHNHDGVNSEPLNSSAITAHKINVSSGSFTDNGDGYYVATVTAPSGRLIIDYVLTMRDPTTKDVIYGKTENVDPQNAKIFINTLQSVEVILGA